jgi:hypothetical protein
MVSGSYLCCNKYRSLLLAQQVRKAAVPRIGGGKLHGGVTGGLRLCTAADLRTWKANLVLGDELDWKYWYVLTRQRALLLG